MRLPAAFIATRAAWIAPREIERRMPAMLVLARDGTWESDATPLRTLRLTTRVLRMLARLPGGRWRATCLYRATAHCLALRAGGRAARVMLGVDHEQRTATATREIVAHAWVECSAIGTVADVAHVARYTGLRTPERC